MSTRSRPPAPRRGDRVRTVRPAVGDTLIRHGRDPLSVALHDGTEWSVQALTRAARDAAADSEDFSLVALAALAADTVVLAALRETVVLYAEMVATGMPPPEIVYEWAVDDEIAARAARFVSRFNELFNECLPEPSPANAKAFWDASDDMRIHGRCVNLGRDQASPPSYYHWAIDHGADGLTVRDFWKPEIWTTKRYKASLGRSWPRAE